MAVERGGHDTDDGNQFDVAGSLDPGTEHRPKHRNVVYRHPAGGFQPKPFLSPAIELTPDHSTFGTRNDRPTQNTVPTVVVCGPVVQGAWYAREMESASIPFDSQWRFIRADVPQAQIPQFDDQTWETVTLPHTAH